MKELRKERIALVEAEWPELKAWLKERGEKVWNDKWGSKEYYEVLLWIWNYEVWGGDDAAPTITFTELKAKYGMETSPLHKDPEFLFQILTDLGCDHDGESTSPDRYEGIDHFVVWCWNMASTRDEFLGRIKGDIVDLGRVIDGL